MKRLINLAIMLCMSLTIFSQIVPEPVAIQLPNINMVCFNKPNQGHIYTTTSENGKYLYTFYNKDFQQVAEIAEYEYRSSSSYNNNGVLIKVYECYNAEAFFSMYDTNSAMAFSQTLLNDDDDIEYLKSANDGKTLQICQVFSGDVIFSLDIDNIERFNDDRYIYLLHLGDNNFLYIGGTIYRIDKNNDSTPLIRVNTNMPKAYPNPIQKGDTLSIDYIADTDVVLSVFSTDGTLLHSSSKKAGQDIKVATDALVPGLYIYTITSSRGKAVNGRFMVE